MITRIKRPVKGRLFVPVRLNNIHSVRTIPKKNLTWAQASIRYPRMQALGDFDHDGKLNMFDCHPFDKKRHSDPNINFGFRDEIPSKFPAKPEKSEFEKGEMLKNIIFKRLRTEFAEEKRKGNVADDDTYWEWVSERKAKKEQKAAKDKSNLQRVRELGLAEEE
jgi:hypothetical protein